MHQRAPENLEEAILVLAPLGRDAELAAAALHAAGMAPIVCGSFQELTEQLSELRGAILIAEEAITPTSLSLLQRCLETQPPWSDIPIVFLTSADSSDLASKSHRALGEILRNVTLLERPIRVQTLTSTLQAALRARRRQYQVRDLIAQRDQIVGSIQDSFVMLDREWRYAYVNQQTCELCQMTEEQMLGHTIWELFPILPGSELETRLRAVMTERVGVSFEWYNEHWQRWFAFRVYPSDVGIALFTVDITQRKRMEEAIREGEQRLHLALDTSRLGTWYCDLPFDKITWDENCKRHFGLPEDSVVDFDLFYSLIHEEDREKTRMAIDHSVWQRTTYDVEYRAIHPDGSVRWIHAIGRAFYKESGEPYRFDGITIDITERKQTELELQRAREEAVEANRAKDSFLAALSHELRTPLAPVLMTAAVLRDDPELPHEVREQLAMIHRNVELEARLIDDLLDLTRIARGKLQLRTEPCNVHLLLEHAVGIVQEDAQTKGIKIQSAFEAQHHWTAGDSVRMQQVFWNLLKNAVKFTPRGGRIQIRTADLKGRLMIEVSDTGIGLTAEAMERIFLPFEQAGLTNDHRFGGLGLGLAISKAVVDLHGGSIRAGSPGLNQGATFTVMLHPTAPVSNREKPEVPRPHLREVALRLLVVEDHVPTLQVLTRLLRRRGHTVEAASTVTDAVALAERQRFDVVISDLGLPDGTGLTLMQQLSTRHGLRGVALSGYGMEEDVARGREAGFYAHLVKPIDFDQLDAVLNEMALSASDLSFGMSV